MLTIVMKSDHKLPSHIFLSSLKTLKLWNAVSLEIYSTQRLFSCCPITEEQGQHDASFCQLDPFLLHYKIILIIQKKNHIEPKLKCHQNG